MLTMRQRIPFHRLVRFGIAFVLLGLCVVLAARCLRPMPTIDFPCEWYGSGLPVEHGPGTRIIYCVSWFPSNTSGGIIEAMGSSETDRATFAIFGRNLVLERNGDTLVVGGHVLQPGETFKDTIMAPSFIPYLNFPVEFALTNGPMLKTNEARYALGSIKGGWLELKSR